MAFSIQQTTLFAGPFAVTGRGVIPTDGAPHVKDEGFSKSSGTALATVEYRGADERSLNSDK
jgi:hypothetical protein